MVCVRWNNRENVLLNIRSHGFDENLSFLKRIVMYPANVGMMIFIPQSKRADDVMISSELNDEKK